MCVSVYSASRLIRNKWPDKRRARILRFGVSSQLSVNRFSYYIEGRMERGGEKCHNFDIPKESTHVTFFLSFFSFIRAEIADVYYIYGSLELQVVVRTFGQTDWSSGSFFFLLKRVLDSFLVVLTYNLFNGKYLLVFKKQNNRRQRVWKISYFIWSVKLLHDEFLSI